MITESAKSIVTNYAEAFNRGDVDAVCALFAPDAQIYGVLGWGGLDVARPIWDQLVRCFRMQLKIESMIAEGDTVAVRYTESGTFVDTFRDTPPTGNSYSITAMEWFVIRDGLIAQRWGARDSAAMFKQMGIPLG